MTSVAIDATTGAITITYDAAALRLRPTVENDFNFTRINIGVGVTVRLTSKVSTGPIYWLATESVSIAGSLDLSGENGHSSNITDSVNRAPAAGGAGGYAGGVGGAPPSTAAEPGNGPGGGAPSTMTFAGLMSR